MKWMKPFPPFLYQESESRPFRGECTLDLRGLRLSRYQRKTLHKPWDVIKTVFYLYILVMLHVFEMHCTVALLATLMQIQIIAHSQVIFS